MVNFCQILITYSVMISLQKDFMNKKTPIINMNWRFKRRAYKSVNRQALPFVLFDHD